MTLEVKAQPISTPEIVFNSLINHANSLINHANSNGQSKLKLSDFASLNEEFELYRKHLRFSEGEGGLAYLLSNSLLTLSRLANNEEYSEREMNDWLGRYQIAQELFNRVQNCLSQLNNQIYSSKKTICMN